MLEKIDLNIVEHSFEEMYQKSFFDTAKTINTPEIVLSIGTSLFMGERILNPTMTAGEFSAIVASSKSGKSAFKSALIAGVMSSNIKNYFDNFYSTNIKGDFGIIDIDTEQSHYYAQRNFKRSLRMAGMDYKNYHCFTMRKYNHDEIINFIDELLKREMVDNPKVMFIDGIADLILDENDLYTSKVLANKLLEWTDVYKIHICCVIHTAYGTTKPTGHLGSSIGKKCETIFALKREDESTEVRSEYTRGLPFEPFAFSLNKMDDTCFQTFAPQQNSIL